MIDETAKTLNQLEGLTERPQHLSPQGERARDLRNVSLRDLTPADLRVLIVEQQGLAHVVPLALDLLAADPRVAGGPYSGALLTAVERIPSGFWLTHPTLRHRVEKLQARALDEFD